MPSSISENTGIKSPHNPSAKKKVYLSVITVAIGVLCAFMIGESACRVLIAISKDPFLITTVNNYREISQNKFHTFRFIPDDVLTYKLKPNFSTLDKDGIVLTQHNENGFRADTAFTKKSLGTFRIICLGGSTTYGVTVENNEATYPIALERYLNGPLKPENIDKVEVYNLGVGGYTSLEVLNNLQQFGMLLEPDFVLIQTAINDVAPRFYPDFKCDYSHFRKPMESLEAPFFKRLLYRSQLFLWAAYNLNRIGPVTLQSKVQYQLPDAANAPENLNKNGTYCFQDNIEKMINIVKPAGIGVVFLTQPFLKHDDFIAPNIELQRMDAGYQVGLTQHNSVIRAICSEKDVPCIDLEADMPLDRRYFADPIHMTELGNTVKAKLIADTLRKIITSK